jgi:hypothetical protein
MSTVSSGCFRTKSRTCPEHLHPDCQGCWQAQQVSQDILQANSDEHPAQADLGRPPHGRVRALANGTGNQPQQM